MIDQDEELARVDEIISRIKRLPPLPESIQRVNQLIDREDSTLDAVAREIAKDQALSAQVLQLVNSSFYGFSENVSSITHAVVMLGVNAVRTLVSSSWVSGMMQNSSSGFYYHSMACARACFVLSRTLGVEEPEELSAIGLLHDIGKVILAEYLLFDFVQVRGLVEEKELRFFEAETELLGITHAALGGRLLQQWNLPASTYLPIQSHHDLFLPAEYTERTAILCLADIMIRAEGFGYAGDERMPPFDHEIVEVLGLSIDDLEPLSNEIADQMRDIPRHKGVFHS
jgi:HD-like signal output (HDOD) protein